MWWAAHVGKGTGTPAGSSSPDEWRSSRHTQQTPSPWAGARGVTSPGAVVGESTTYGAAGAADLCGTCRGGRCGESARERPDMSSRDGAELQGAKASHFRQKNNAIVLFRAQMGGSRITRTARSAAGCALAVNHGWAVGKVQLQTVTRWAEGTAYRGEYGTQPVGKPVRKKAP